MASECALQQMQVTQGQNMADDGGLGTHPKHVSCNACPRFVHELRVVTNVLLTVLLVSRVSVQ
jgi:hypothetical protein